MLEEQKYNYFRELSIRLKYEGFQTRIQEDGMLAVSRADKQLCVVDENAGIRFKPEELAEGEEELVRGRVKDAAVTTKEYLKLMESAPTMSTGNEIDHYKMLAAFNGVVLAAHDSGFGVQFVTWNWDQDRKGVHWGHYYGRNYEEAKQDFAIRSDLMPEQMTEIYRCIHKTLESDYPITDNRRKLLESAANQIEQSVYDLENRVNQSMSRKNRSPEEQARRAKIRELLQASNISSMDAIHYHVRSEGQVIKETVYIAIGIDLGGKKDVLGMWVGENESAKF